MRSLPVLGVLALLLLASAACRETRDEEWDWKLPAHFPPPRVPAENPMHAAKVELGRHLFYDRRLSANQTQACASCHRQELAFSDGRVTALGSTGAEHRRNSMSLANVAYTSRLTWANPHLDRLESQALIPMFGDDPVELGLVDDELLLGRLRVDRQYVAMFAAAFADDTEPIRVANVTRALASFQRTLISAASPYDRYLAGDLDALSSSARRGMDLFFSERLECFHCHGGFNFADSVDHARLIDAERAFHNTGLYNVDGRGAYPRHDRGVMDISGLAVDMGRFKAPSLRNIALTAPYMHDGSVVSLDDAIEHYVQGGRMIESGPHAGVGSESPLKDEFIVGFLLDERDRADLLAFLHSLTDENFITDPRFSDPFTAPRPDGVESP